MFKKEAFFFFFFLPRHLKSDVCFSISVPTLLKSHKGTKKKICEQLESSTAVSSLSVIPGSVSQDHGAFPPAQHKAAKPVTSTFFVFFFTIFFFCTIL